MLILLVAGFAAAVGQVILARELIAVCHGDELSLGMILANWLLWTALGSFAGTRLVVSGRHPKAAIGTAFAILAFILPASVAFCGLGRFIFGIPAGEVTGMGEGLLITLLALSPFCLVSGTIFPLGCSILGPHKAGVWKAYFLEALGAALGGLVFTFGLVHLRSSLQASLVISFLLTGAAYFIRRRRHHAVAALLFLVALSCGDRLSDTIQQVGFPGVRLVRVTDSRYGKLSVFAREECVYFYENGVLLFAFPDIQAVEDSVHPALLQLERPEDILLVGGGVSGILGEILKYPSVKRIDYLELDPEVVALARRYVPLSAAVLGSPAVRVINQDARRFIKTAACTYDCVLMRLPDPLTTMINRFYTAEFFAEVKKVVRKNGLCAFEVSSAEEAIGPAAARFLKSILVSVGDVFPEVMVIPGSRACFLAAPSKGTLSLDPVVLQARLHRQAIATRFFECYLPFRLEPMRREYLSQTLSASDGRANRDLFPSAYVYSNLLWNVQLTPAAKETAAAILHSGRAIMTAATTVLVFAVVAGCKRRRGDPQRNAVLSAVAVTGFTEILLEIIIILLFQITYGHVYYKLGLLLALYMVGLSLGSIDPARNPVARLAGGRLWRIQAALSAQITVLVLIAAFFFTQFRVAVWEYIFYAVILLTGLSGGAHFALAVEKAPGLDPGTVGGTVYGVDLLGSFLGAALAGTLFIPVFGIPNLLYCLLTVNLLTAGLLFRARV